jgi:AraC family transcriptional regulator
MSTLAAGQYFGAVLQNRECAGAVLSEVRHSHPKKLPVHSHDLAFLCLLLDGSYSERFGGSSLEYRPFTVAFHPPGFRHRDEIGNSGGRFFCVQARPSILSLFAEEFTALDSTPDLRGGDTLWLTLRLFQEHRADAPALVLESLAVEALAAALRVRSHSETGIPHWLKRVTARLHDEFAFSLSLEDLARETRVHPVHLARAFRRYHGQTPGEYQRRLRLRFACEELRKPSCDLAALSHDAGFTDQSHFTRVFKERLGLTPGAFRRLYR